MADHAALPGRPVLEDGVRRLLERARQRSHASAADMVSLLGPLQAKTAGTRRSWYDWQERPETVSALTVLGALHLLGPGAVIEAVFGREAERAAAPSAEEQVDALQRQLREVQEELARQRSRNQAVEARLEEVESRLEPSGRSASAVSDSRPASVERHLEALEADVARLGRELGRQWEAGEGISYADMMASPSERLVRRMGTLEARVAEIASMVGAPYGGYPSTPDPSAGEVEHEAWSEEVAAILRRQLDQVAKLTPGFRSGGRTERRAGESSG